MIARRTPAATILVLAAALAGCELVAGIEERPLGDAGADAPGTGGTAGAGGAGGRGGAGGSEVGGAGATGGAVAGGGRGGTSGGAGAGGAGGSTGGAGAGGAGGAAGRGGSGGAAGTTGTAGTTGSGGTAGIAGTTGSAGTGGAAGRGGTTGAAGSGGTAGSGGAGGFVCPPAAVAANQAGIAAFETGPAIGTGFSSINVTTQSGIDAMMNASVTGLGVGSLKRVTDAHGGTASLSFGITLSGADHRAGTLYLRFAPVGGAPPGANAACVDVTRYRGIRFWAKGPASVTLSVYTPQSQSDGPGVVNHAGSMQFGVNNTWSLVEVPWEEFQRQPGALYPFETDALWFFTFVLDSLQDVTLQLDDIAFME